MNTTTTTPETAETDPQSLAIVLSNQWQPLPPPPQDRNLMATLQRLIAATDRMAEEIEKLKTML